MPIRDQQPHRLFMNSGIQCIDHDFMINPELPPTAFIRASVGGPLREVFSDASGHYFYRPTVQATLEWVRPEYLFSLTQSLLFLQQHWLPVPYMTQGDNNTWRPTNWVRVFLAPIPNIAQGWRVTFAFDTTISDDDNPLQPSQFDVQKGQLFTFCQQPEQWQTFIDLPWVTAWLTVIAQTAGEDPDAHHTAFLWQAHYLNLLKYLSQQLTPRPLLLSNVSQQDPIIAVEAIIDLGNSHSCGVLYEAAERYADPLAACSEVMIRDLSYPTHMPSSLFSSDVNFCPDPFGDNGLSSASGRLDAFQWYSPVRIGAEAQRLNAGSHHDLHYQGITSPRRYLWDETPSPVTWFTATGTQPAHYSAIDHPFNILIDDRGIPLNELSAALRTPLFIPRFSRSTLLTLFIVELINQMAVQINSLHYRQRLRESDLPRYLKRISFTLPVNFTALERKRFELLARRAVTLSQTAQPHFYPINRDAITIHFPWDEACCGQIFWLWQQLRDHSVENLINRYHQHSQTAHLRVALIDVGGGTTDLAITEYRTLVSHTDQTLALSPQLLSRQGFTLAGDSVLEDIIRYFLFPQLAAYCQQQGLESADKVLVRLFSRDTRDNHNIAWRQYIIRHLFLPVVDDILNRYRLNEESYYCRVSQLLEKDIFDYCAASLIEKIQALTDSSYRLELSQLCFTFTFSELEQFLKSETCRLSTLLQTISDTVTENQCDVLLMSGQVMALPVFTEPFQLPSLHRCHLTDIAASPILPFCSGGKLENGKQATSLGGLLHRITTQRNNLAQVLLAGDISMIPVARWYGPLDKAGKIMEPWLTPPHQGTIRTRARITGTSVIGYRCLESSALDASPFFVIIPDPQRITQLALGIFLELEWYFDQEEELSALPTIQSITDSQQQIIPHDAVSLKMNTLSMTGQMDDSHWRDDGGIL